MTINITTWGPDTCSCEFSYTTDDENPNNSVFYAVHQVCPHHAHLATPHLAKKADHMAKTQTKMTHIHTAIQRNVEQHQQALARATRRTHRQDLEALEPTIHQHNAKVKMMFEDIFGEPFAHDEHIYKAVLAENQTKNIAIGHLIEQNPHLKHEDITFSHDKARKLTLHLTKDAETKPTEQKFGVTIRRVG